MRWSEDHWQALLKRLHLHSDQLGHFRKLEKLYSSRYRCYHDIQHIEDCLDLLETYRSLAESPDLIEAARAGFESELEKLELQLDAAGSFIGGPEPCLADCGFPVTIHMGRDLLADLGVQVDCGEKVDALLAAAAEHKIFAEEISNNRSAIADWIASCRRG